MSWISCRPTLDTWVVLFLKPASSQEATTYRVDGHHRAIIGPGAQLHAAVLLIEGEMGDNDLTVAFVDGWRRPGDVAGVVQEHLGEFDNGKVAICTTVGMREKWLQSCLLVYRRAPQTSLIKSLPGVMVKNPTFLSTNQVW